MRNILGTTRWLRPGWWRSIVIRGLRRLWSWRRRGRRRRRRRIKKKNSLNWKRVKVIRTLKYNSQVSKVCHLLNNLWPKKKLAKKAKRNNNNQLKKNKPKPVQNSQPKNPNKNQNNKNQKTQKEQKAKSNSSKTSNTAISRSPSTNIPWPH